MAISAALDELPAAFTHADARRLGVSDRRLYAWRDDGSLEQIARGVYWRPGEGGDPDLVEIALRVPRATLCLGTALVRHGLSDEIPAAIDVAIPRTRRPPRLAAPVTWHRFAKDTFDHGREEIQVLAGCRLGLYDPVRTLVDAFRLRHLEGHEQAHEALRRWLRRRGSQPSALLQMARHFPKAERSIRTALEILT